MRRLVIVVLGPMEMIKDKVSMHGQIPMDQIQGLLLEILVLMEWELLVVGTTAFGMYSTGGSGYVNATRIFDLGMQIGDTQNFYWAINWDANSGSKGFDLLDGASTVVNVNNGGSATITLHRR